MEKKPPATRGFYWALAFLLIVGLAMIGGGVYAWTDEHGGTAGEARVTRCESQHISSRQSGVHCDATWTYNGRTVTGYVENAKMNYAGKTISGRIHGTSHITVTTYWVPIGLALFGLLEIAMVVWLFGKRPGRPQPT